MKKLLAAGSLLALFALAAVAADVTGTWKSTMETPNGTRETTFVLKQDGDKLTGTVSGPRGGQTEIKDGKVDGDQIEFKVERRRPGSDNAFTITYKGKVSGDKIEGTVGFGDNSREWTATRTKEKKD